MLLLQLIYKLVLKLFRKGVVVYIVNGKLRAHHMFLCFCESNDVYPATTLRQKVYG